MECPHCGAELTYSDWYLRGNYSSGDYEKLGDIYKCPNFEGFADQEEAKAYVEANNLRVGKNKTFETLEEVCCSSADFNGNFYTDMQENLHEGYPC
jgi:hypothetical protein